MNPELQKALSDVLDVVRDGAKFAAAQAKQELPLLVEEYLKWGFAEALIWSAVCLVVFVCGVVAVKRGWAYGCSPETAETPIGAMAVCIGIVVLVASSVALLHNALAATQILIAPRVYLVERLSELVQ